MSTRNFDASQIFKRRAEKAIAQSFSTQAQSLTRGGPPIPLVKTVATNYNSSVINEVKTGGMTEYVGGVGCVSISPGCPCGVVVQPVSPGPVRNITFSVGSIIVSWEPPLRGDGPFTYRITPILNGVAQVAVITHETTYRFINVDEWMQYTFRVCAINAVGEGPDMTSASYFIAPPRSLSTIMDGGVVEEIEPCLKYVINAGLDTMLKYIAATNLGPTRGSRLMYAWIASIAGAWSWVQAGVGGRITGIHDGWNWDARCVEPLSKCDSIIWLCMIIDYITPFFVGTRYKSIYQCPVEVMERVRADGQWDFWLVEWQNWYGGRQQDGYIAAGLVQPTASANWNQTIIVDGSTVNNISGFSEPREWTRLTVQGKKQNYLTYSWDSVISTCLDEEDEEAIQNLVEPLTGAARDAEIDAVKNMSVGLSDEQKIIAEFWAGGPGTVSPPLMFIWLWKEYIRSVELGCPDIMLSLLDLAVHLFEGGRITWRLKAAHMEARPIQEIRRRYTGQQIASWMGVVDGSQWVPYQEAYFITPPFADFPSGHSHFSKAFALTMNKWFGPNISKVPITYDGETLICPLFSTNQNTFYGNFNIKVGTSLIQPGVVPSRDMTLSFTIWDEMANQAGLSRLYGGIHAITAHEASQTVAVAVHERIQATWNIQ